MPPLFPTGKKRAFLQIRRHGSTPSRGASSWITRGADRTRRDNQDQLVYEGSQRAATEDESPVAADCQEMNFPDDRLRLIFTCCHPALNTEAQVGLTLHTLGGLTTPK
jgi:RNA polymerase sigma-70 factor (ECF subfamily)